MFFEAMDL